MKFGPTNSAWAVDVIQVMRIAKQMIGRFNVHLPENLDFRDPDPNPNEFGSVLVIPS